MPWLDGLIGRDAEASDGPAPAGIPAILGVLIFGLAINPSVTLFDHGTIESLHTLSLSMLLFYAGLKTDLRSIRGFV